MSSFETDLIEHSFVMKHYHYANNKFVSKMICAMNMIIGLGVQMSVDIIMKVSKFEYK